MKDLDDFTIAIVGLGLVGGSLAMALKQNRVGWSIRGADANPQVVVKAIEMGAIDGPYPDGTDVDLIVLAMPVRAIVQWLESESKQLAKRDECIVMDVGSTKQAIITEMENMPVQCVGGHPMCGKETSGIGAADARLFNGAKFVLTPTSRTTSHTLSIVQTLVERIGAQPVLMDAESHDRAVAAISHLPYLLSVNLVNTVDGLHDERAQLLAASGYQSMTRLAASHPQLMADIIATNRANILGMIDRYQTELSQLRQAIAESNEECWRAKLEQAEKVKRDV